MAGKPAEELGFRFGARLPYHWLTSEEQYGGIRVRSCPEIFVGSHLAVTAIDSGAPWLTAEQSAAGWTIRSGIVYSPKLTSTDELFFQRDGLDVAGFDEWYLFEDLPQLGERITQNPFLAENEPRPGRLLPLVNYPNFDLRDPGPGGKCFQTIFWKQLDWITPESYVGDGYGCLTFVTKNAPLFDKVREALIAGLAA